MTQVYDVVVVGGGAPGLSAAKTLLRSRRSVLVVDAGRPRNAPAEGVHNLLGLEGVAPLELLRVGREEVESYGGRVRVGHAVSAARDADGFDVRLEDGDVVRGRMLVVATGLTDGLPDVPGLAEHWGTSVLHCPYCHGWEVRDRAIGVLASSPVAAHQALLFQQLSDDVVVFRRTADALPDEDVERLEALGVRFVDGEVVEVVAEDGHVAGVRLASGDVVERDVLTVQTDVVAVSTLLDSLGVPTQDVEMGGHILGRVYAADPTGRTVVPGVWVTGNVAAANAQVGASAAAGVQTGAMVNYELVLQDAARAR